MNTKLLRQQILDLAIRGKLVKQDPNDEPASVLLERIRAEKEQLIQQGKIKKTKASATTDTPHYQNTPFDIPNSWQWVQVEDIALSINNGANIKQKKGAGGLPITRIETISNDCFNRDRMGYADIYDVLPYEKYRLNTGDILISHINSLPYLGRTVMYYAKENETIIHGMNLLRLIPDKNIIPNFIVFAFRTSKFKRQIDRNAHQTVNQASINIAAFSGLLIPLPPLAEQKRIVAEIEKWFALIDELDANKQDLQGAIKQVRAKVLDLAIHGKLVPQAPTDESAIDLLRRINPHYPPSDTSHYQNVPFDIPASWEWVLHNDIINLVGGSQPPKSNFSSENREGYIRLYQIRDYGTTPVPVYIPLDLAQKRTNKGDILLARYGGSLGKVFRAEYGAYNVAMTKVVVKYTGLIDIDFAYIYYLAPIYQHKLKTISRTAQVGFNEVDFFDLYFPLPPLAEQRRIVSEIERIFGVLDTIEENFR